MIEYGQLDQYLLIRHLGAIAQWHHDFEGDNNPYTDLILINSENPQIAMNRVINCNKDVYNLFSNLTTIQKAALIPKIEIFYKRENVWKTINFRNFPDFNEFSNFATDVNTKFGFKENEKEDGVGIKRITINDRNQNPGSVNLECTIELFFDSILALTNSSVLSLIQTADTRASSSEKEFRLKLVTGWSTPTDYSQEIFSPEELTLIEKSNSVYLLSLVKHDLTFNQNGSINLTITYQGAMEKYLASSSEMDIFGNSSPEQLLKFLVHTAKGNSIYLTDYIKESHNKIYYESLIDTLSKSKLSPAEQQKTAAVLGTLTKEKEENNEAHKKIDEKIKTAQEKLDTSLKRLSEIEMFVVKHKYAMFLQALKNKNRLFFLPIEAIKYTELIKNVQSTDSNIREKSLDSVPISPENIGTFSRPDHMKKAAFELISKQIDSYIKKISDRKSDNSNADFRKVDIPTPEEIDAVTDKELADISTLTLELQTFINSSGEEDSFDHRLLPENYKKGKFKLLTYTTLGDIINITRQFLHIPEEDIFEILIGPCNVGSVAINIAQFPIAISTFMIWFVNTVIRQAKRKYQFWEFIYDIVNSLITPFLRLDGLIQKETVNVNLTKSLIISDQKLDKGKSYLDTNLYSHLSRNIFDTKNIYSYLALYVYDYELDKRDGIFSEDALDGIYHYSMARDRGIIKSIDFSKIDFPRLRDMRLTSEGFNNVGDLLREHYNMNLKTIGSPLFVVGSQVYFDGSYLGESGRNITELLGLGGYYLVTKIETSIAKELYETNVECTWTSMRKTAAELYTPIKVGKEEPGT